LVCDFTPHVSKVYSLLLQHAHHSRGAAAVHSKHREDPVYCRVLCCHASVKG
jgi:hypothetical protein